MTIKYPLSIKFCFEIDSFDINTYHFKTDFSNQIRLVEMTSSSTLNDVSLFVGSLLSFNEISFNSKFIDALFKKDELALVGGLLFEQNNFKIGASCCADFQDWKLVVGEINKGVSPWMGHDPSPWFEFKDKNIVLWSDEEKVDGINCIQFSQNEFEQQIKFAKQELFQFVEKIRIWSSINFEIEQDELIKGIKHYLLI